MTGRGAAPFRRFLIGISMACAMAPAGASAQRAGVLAGHTMSGQAIPCVTAMDGIRVCHGDAAKPGDTDLRLKSFDGTPLSVYVTLPPAPVHGADGGYPAIIQSHGWGAPPSGPDDGQFGSPTATQLARDGYAVIAFAARGWGNSCGTPQSRLID